MDHMIYTALSGASQALSRQAIISNNMANASTTGFKAQMSMMRAVPVNGAGNPTRAIVADTTPASRFMPGPIEQTGRSLDVAIDGDGWLAVQDGNGDEAYTRAGNLQQDSTGVVLSNGRPVLDDGGQPLVLPLAAQISVASDGTISALGAGDQPNTLGQVGNFKLVKPDNAALVRGDDGLFRQRSAPGQKAQALPADDSVRIASGALESSNVSPVESMVSMISNARAYEMQMKMVSTAKENAQTANRLLSLE